MNKKDMDAIDENYSTATDAAIEAYLVKAKGGLYARGTSELLKVECIGTIEENGEVAPLAELIDRLKDGQKVQVIMRVIPLEY